MRNALKVPKHTMQPARNERDRLSPVSDVPDLSPKEQDAVAAQSRPNAALIHETIRAEGESELERTWWALITSGIAAGLSMGFSLVVEGLLQSHLPDAPWRELISKFGYTAGFLIVVLGRQQLFTENTLTPILPLLHNRNRRHISQGASLMGSGARREYRRDLGDECGPRAH